MKKIKFPLAVVAALMASIMLAQSVTTVITVAAGAVWNATNLVSGSSRITAITIAQPSFGSVTNTTFALVDCPVVPTTASGWYALGLSNGGYMTLSSYLTNILYIRTNFGGVYTNADGTTNWMTVSNALYTYTNYVGATTNGWRVLGAGTVASNGSTSLTLPSSGIPVIFGLGLTNNNAGVALTVTITYTPSL